MYIMMLCQSRTFIYNAWLSFRRTTFCTSFFCITITPTGWLHCYGFICMRTGWTHIHCIYKNSTPHKLIIVICFFTVSNITKLFFINFKILHISAIIRVVITFLKFVAIAFFWIIYILYTLRISALTWNKCIICCHRYVHLIVFFNCHCCNWMVCNSKVSNTFILCNSKCHSTKCNWIITFSVYSIIFFYSFNCSFSKIVTQDTIAQIKVKLTII